jgi:two-component system LytT family response regulator
VNTLIVDDKQLAVNALKRVMLQIDPEGRHMGALSAQAALRHAESNPVDVAFLDIEMPEMNGLELAKHLQKLQQRINIIFVTGHTQYALEALALYASGFLVKPASEEDVRDALAHLREPLIPASKELLRIQCFGNFEVFAGEKPLRFRRGMTKELMAFLVDRKGAACDMGELLAVLWEDKPDSHAQRNYLRNLIYDLRATLEEVGAADVLIRRWKTLAINCGKVKCDYYDYLRQSPDATGLYKGEYMKQYSWAEMTTGALEF